MYINLKVISLTMTSIIIEKPTKTQLDDTKIKFFFENVLEEYSDFDIELMNRYFETKELPREQFTDI